MKRNKSNKDGTVSFSNKSYDDYLTYKFGFSHDGLIESNGNKRLGNKVCPSINEILDIIKDNKDYVYFFKKGLYGSKRNK